jgi:tetratricopeptide (TPR) repeat protein
LGEASAKLRGQLGESLASVQKHDVPLIEATTSSLDALKAYSMGRKVQNQQSVGAALPYFQKAIELDPNFASVYASVGSVYVSQAQLGRASEYYRKAYELRDHVSDREKSNIEINYFEQVTGDLVRALRAREQYLTVYPGTSADYNGLSLDYASLGQYEKSLDDSKKSIQADPSSLIPRTNLGNILMALQRFAEARQIIQQSFALKMDSFLFHGELHAMAFLAADAKGMDEEQKWFASHPDDANFGLASSSDTEAYRGRLAKAREIIGKAAESAVRADAKENGGIWLENNAIAEASFGNSAQARRQAMEGLKLAPESQGANVEAALAYAMVGDTARAESMAQDLDRKYTQDTQMQELWLSAVRAQIALNRRDPQSAISELRKATGDIEYGQIGFVGNLSCLYPTYIRAEAYLAAGQGKESAVEFQKILDHTGIVWNCWTASLAHLGIARANALLAKSTQGADADLARTRSLAAYKDFLALWKDADPDLALLKQAKSEYAKLQ